MRLQKRFSTNGTARGSIKTPLEEQDLPKIRMPQNNLTKQFNKMKDVEFIMDNIESIEAQVPLLTQNLDP